MKRARDSNDLDEARKLSRQKYVKDRTLKIIEQKKELLREEVEAFDDSELTPAERRQRQLELEAIAKAEQWNKITDGDQEKSKYDEMPEEQRMELVRAQAAEANKERAKIGESNKYEILIDFQVSDVLDGVDLDQLAKPATEEKKKGVDRDSIRAVRKSLPIYEYRDVFLQHVRDNQCIILVGETGSGKTTQLTQYLAEDGYTKDGKRIACTQPRRVAAMSVAQRVAQEVGCRLGHEVGYKIRFEDKTSERTNIVYMTDGMMLKEFLQNPMLDMYSAIIIDEAHERSLHTDVALGLVKDIARARPDLKLIISSATLQAQKFSEFFNDCPILTIPGRRFKVEILHTLQPEADYIEAAITCVIQIHLNEKPGDVLVFLSGQDEIEECAAEITRRLEKRPGIPELVVCPVYSALPAEKQLEIFRPAPPAGRKVVIATNIAETSLTIDGIVYVIDAGFCKENSYNPRAGMEQLVVVPISKASAVQRAGRAGRTRAGKCFRLYTKWAFEKEMDDSHLPEIQRTNLVSVVLLLKSLGIHDLLNFDFMDAPSSEAMMKALEQLYCLGALNHQGNLTKTGRRMAEFPLDPQLARALLASEDFNCSEAVCTICAMLSVNNNVFHIPRDNAALAEAQKKHFFSPSGDHISFLRVYNEWAEADYSPAWCKDNFIQYKSMQRARDIREQLEKMMERVEVSKTSQDDDAAIKKAFLSGYFFHTATINTDKQTYRTFKSGTTNHTVFVHPSSYVFIRKEEQNRQYPQCVLYHELVLTKEVYMRHVLEIDYRWLNEIAPHYFKDVDIDGMFNKKKMPKMPAPAKA